MMKKSPDLIVNLALGAVMLVFLAIAVFPAAARFADLQSITLPRSADLQSLVLLAQLAVMLWAVKIARNSIRAHRKLESQKAFLAFINAYTCAPESAEAVSFLRGEEKKIDGETDDAFALRRARRVKSLLNQFETLAIGIRAGIYDRQMAVMAYGADLAHYHQLAEKFIADIRAKDHHSHEADIAYKHFENLAQEIRKNTRNPAA